MIETLSGKIFETNAAACAVMLWVWKKKKGLLPAILICAATAVLLIAYSMKNWEETQLEPMEDMIRYIILYGTMVVDLVAIGLAIRLNMQEESGKLRAA